ncbi:MAG: hypothetical protein ACRDND_06525 [Streptosporangiaceae bacterium]
MTATHSPGGTTLDGEALYVVDSRVAGVLLIAARGEGGAGLYRVAADAPGLTRTAETQHRATLAGRLGL